MTYHATKIENEGNWRIYFVWKKKLVFLLEVKHTLPSTFGMSFHEFQISNFQ